MEGLSTRDARRRPSPEVARDEEWLRGKRYALVIGIDDYHPPVPPLSNAVKDAAAIADRLRDDFGFDGGTQEFVALLVLSSPPQAELSAALRPDDGI